MPKIGKFICHSKNDSSTVLVLDPVFLSLDFKPLCTNDYNWNKLNRELGVYGILHARSLHMKIMRRAFASFINFTRNDQECKILLIK